MTAPIWWALAMNGEDDAAAWTSRCMAALALYAWDAHVKRQWALRLELDPNDHVRTLLCELATTAASTRRADLLGFS